MSQLISKTVLIKAPPAALWECLTNPVLMTQWMAEPEIDVQVDTDWQVGSTVTVSGFHHVSFINKGTVLQFDPLKALRYTHLSSVSHLPEKPESYCVFEFLLEPSGNGTFLTVNISNFPTESIFRHLDLYWKTTVAIFKDFVEKNFAAAS